MDLFKGAIYTLAAAAVVRAEGETTNFCGAQTTWKMIPMCNGTGEAHFTGVEEFCVDAESELSMQIDICEEGEATSTIITGYSPSQGTFSPIINFTERAATQDNALGLALPSLEYMDCKSTYQRREVCVTYCTPVENVCRGEDGYTASAEMSKLENACSCFNTNLPIEVVATMHASDGQTVTEIVPACIPILASRKKTSLKRRGLSSSNDSATSIPIASCWGTGNVLKVTGFVAASRLDLHFTFTVPMPNYLLEVTLGGVVYSDVIASATPSIVLTVPTDLSVSTIMFWSVKTPAGCLVNMGSNKLAFIISDQAGSAAWFPNSAAGGFSNAQILTLGLVGFIGTIAIGGVLWVLRRSICNRNARACLSGCSSGLGCVKTEHQLAERTRKRLIEILASHYESDKAQWRSGNLYPGKVEAYIAIPPTFILGVRVGCVAFDLTELDLPTNGSARLAIHAYLQEELNMKAYVVDSCNERAMVAKSSRLVSWMLPEETSILSSTKKDDDSHKPRIGKDNAQYISESLNKPVVERLAESSRDAKVSGSGRVFQPHPEVKAASKLFKIAAQNKADQGCCGKIFFRSRSKHTGSGALMLVTVACLLGGSTTVGASDPVSTTPVPVVGAGVSSTPHVSMDFTGNVSSIVAATATTPAFALVSWDVTRLFLSPGEVNEFSGSAGLTASGYPNQDATIGLDLTLYSEEVRFPLTQLAICPVTRVQCTRTVVCASVLFASDSSYYPEMPVPKEGETLLSSENLYVRGTEMFVNSCPFSTQTYFSCALIGGAENMLLVQIMDGVASPQIYMKSKDQNGTILQEGLLQAADSFIEVGGAYLAGYGFLTNGESYQYDPNKGMLLNTTANVGHYGVVNAVNGKDCSLPCSVQCSLSGCDGEISMPEWSKLLQPIYHLKNSGDPSAGTATVEGICPQFIGASDFGLEPQPINGIFYEPVQDLVGKGAIISTAQQPTAAYVSISWPNGSYVSLGIFSATSPAFASSDPTFLGVGYINSASGWEANDYFISTTGTTGSAYLCEALASACYGDPTVSISMPNPCIANPTSNSTSSLVHLEGSQSSVGSISGYSQKNASWLASGSTTDFMTVCFCIYDLDLSNSAGACKFATINTTLDNYTANSAHVSSLTDVADAPSFDLCACDNLCAYKHGLAFDYATMYACSQVIYIVLGTTTSVLASVAVLVVVIAIIKMCKPSLPLAKVASRYIPLSALKAEEKL